MIRTLNALLDGITMYRLVLYVLSAIFAAALGLGFFSLIAVSPADLCLSLVLLLGTCLIVNWAFAKAFDTPTNRDSSIITALILVLLMQPAAATDMQGIAALLFAGLWATASKYLFAIGRKHIFNPAAAGILLTDLLINHPASWWGGSSALLLPVVVIGGLAITRKLRRFDLVLVFLAVHLATIAALTPEGTQLDAVLQSFTLSPMLFFAFIMLTEPLTAPQARWPRLAYAAIVGVLAAPTVHFGEFYLTPEMALLIGNALVLLIDRRGRFVLTLREQVEAATNAFEYVFTPDRPVKFRAGQYMEWTLDVPHPDNRGSRRYLTIASAPSDSTVRLGVKFYPEPSAFKRTLARMQPGDRIIASQVAGSFVLPRDRKRKLAFIAGGIGITPFRSMLDQMLATDDRRDVVLVYGNARRNEIAYADVIGRAERELGLGVINVLAELTADEGKDKAGLVTRSVLESAVPDYLERTFYVSGPPAMVNAVRRSLLELGVPRGRIRQDFFPGLA